MFATASFLFAQANTPIWSDPLRFGMSVLSTIVFGVVGIGLAIVGFKLFDMLTPGKLEEEIVNKQNMALAIMVGAMSVGVCIIIAAAVH